MNRTVPLMLSTVLLLGMFPANGSEELGLEELMSGWGTDLGNINITSEALAPGLHVIRGAGGAVLASIGTDGVLLIDDQFAQGVPKLTQHIAELGGGRVDFVVNTHWHFDHADGNPLLGEAGAQIIAHSHARRRMTRHHKVAYVGYHYVQPPYVASGLPRLTFDESLSLHLNGQQIDIVHYGAAHTDGDVVVHFRDDNVLHVGDLYSARYPYIDVGNGGTLAGLIAVCRLVADTIDDRTQIVSGHSPLAGRSDWLAYISMLESTYQELSDLAAEGRNLEQIIAARPTAEYDAERGDPTLFLTMAYQSLSDPVDGDQ